MKPTSAAKSACLFTLYTFLLPSFHPHLIPPDENLVGHIKASALGPAALDLRESDLLLVLWSLSQSSLKGRLQPSCNNPLLSTQVEQKKSTQCNPVDRGRMENGAWPHHTTSPHQSSLSSIQHSQTVWTVYWSPFGQGGCVHEHHCKPGLYDFQIYNICPCFDFQLDQTLTSCAVWHIA